MPGQARDRHRGKLKTRRLLAAPAVSFGVQGYVEELPPSFTSAVVLIGRPGIAATQMAWGEAVRRNAGTNRLTLDKDILNAKVTYWTDNGAYYCYCNTYRSTPDRRVPMHVTIKALKAYHKSIGLHIDMYHLDSGFWHSAHSDGRCDGTQANLELGLAINCPTTSPPHPDTPHTHALFCPLSDTHSLCSVLTI